MYLYLPMPWIKICLEFEHESRKLVIFWDNQGFFRLQARCNQAGGSSCWRLLSELEESRQEQLDSKVSHSTTKENGTLLAVLNFLGIYWWDQSIQHVDIFQQFIVE